MHFLLFVALLASLAGRVLSLNITLKAPLGSIPPSQFLAVSDQALQQNCQSQCSPGTSAIQACTDDACLCGKDTVQAITACQQCMFNDLVRRFATSPDPRAGSPTALSAYVKACNVSGIAVPATAVALTPPPNWNGPFGQGLNMGTTVIGVIVAIVLGFGCLFVVNSM